MLLLQNDREQPRGWTLVPSHGTCWPGRPALASSDQTAQNHRSSPGTALHCAALHPLLSIQGECFSFICFTVL